MRRSLLVVGLAAMMVMALGVGTAFAGEVTGNGKNLWTDTHFVNGEVHHDLHGKSLCAFSGQEDAQFYDEETGEPLPGDVEPGGRHFAQSWGQIPKAARDTFPAAFHPGNSCNPNGEPLAE